MPLTSGGIYYADNSTAMSVADITAAMATSINNAIGAEWTAYTPTVTGGTSTATNVYYALSGTVMHIVGYVTLSAVSGSLRLSIPSGWNIRNTITSSIAPLGQAIFNDVGTARYHGHCMYENTTSFSLRAQLANATYVGQATTSSTVPFTWASGDQIAVNVTIPVTAI
jgi:hypothetical protein